MAIEDLLSRVALALAIGLLIGIERGWRTRAASAGSRTAGIRTFGLTGLLGGVAGAIAGEAGGIATAGGGLVLGLGFAAYAAVIATFGRDENRADKTFSATTTVAAMLTFMLGACALLVDPRIAAAASVAAAGLLALREGLHGWVGKLSWEELRSGLMLLAMTFIALPIVPDEAVGPWGGVNLREVWIIAIVLAAVSFLGYAAVKYLGPTRGILVAAAAGGLVSSTAVTVANAHRAASGESAPRLLAGGVAVATAISFLRVLAIVAALEPGLLRLLLPSLAAATIFAAGFAAVSAFRPGVAGDDRQITTLRNPFGFWTVVGFAAFLAVVLVVARGATEAFGAAGATLSAAIVGFADVDAGTISVARLVPDALDARSGTLAILAAVASNTTTKLVVGAVIGHGRFAAALGVLSLGCLIPAGIALWATFALLG